MEHNLSEHSITQESLFAAQDTSMNMNMNMNGNSNNNNHKEAPSFLTMKGRLVMAAPGQYANNNSYSRGSNHQYINGNSNINSNGNSNGNSLSSFRRQPSRTRETTPTQSPNSSILYSGAKSRLGQAPSQFHKSANIPISASDHRRTNESNERSEVELDAELKDLEIYSRLVKGMQHHRQRTAGYSNETLRQQNERCLENIIKTRNTSIDYDDCDSLGEFGYQPDPGCEEEQQQQQRPQQSDYWAYPYEERTSDPLEHSEVFDFEL